jgi:hypothetical protein
MYTHIDCSNVHTDQGRISFQTTYRLEELARLKLRYDLQATGSTFNVWEGLPPYAAGLRAADRGPQQTFATFGMPLERDGESLNGCPYCGDLCEEEDETDIIDNILFGLSQLVKLLTGAVFCMAATVLLLSFAIVARIILFLLELEL